MKTYIFKVELEEEDGIWQAVVPALPGCNAWGNTQEEALIAIQENTKAYLEILIEEHQPRRKKSLHTWMWLITSRPASAIFAGNYVPWRDYLERWRIVLYPGIPGDS